jgi:hypothetical protein
MSYNLKITVYNNRDYEQPFTLRDSEGVIFDLTGCKLAFAIASDVKTLTTHVSDSASNKCIFVDDAVDGIFRLVLPYSVLKTLPAGNYTHDLILTDTDDKRSGVWSGSMVVKKGVVA